ncbi:hypothetical protein Lepto7376_3753 [[Leptolyngbya] sp. PCC 7376]|uniref:hypothetical protein n=1 Tax=[Leptolyngbya] sp. PCC 7376 TaxID=111781 RepID=UPI00029EEF15|nr:hypothetical protein [[Leptolyngbya] sp. PCC 7376]AFY39927.1 hypothetical protein Lepto7376_3753 [[Leptolyngbya] sp. PCC 7376]
MFVVCEIVHETYPVYSRQQVLEALQIGADRLRGITGTLNKLNPVGWDYCRYQRNFSSESFEVLKLYKSLVDSLGEKGAILNIHSVCKEKFKDVVQS